MHTHTHTTTTDHHTHTHTTHTVTHLPLTSSLIQYVKERLQLVPSCTVKYFSFCQDRDSVLNSPEGRQRLGEVGVNSPRDVGEWMVDVFKNKLDQNELAERLDTFIHRQ